MRINAVTIERDKIENDIFSASIEVENKGKLENLVVIFKYSLVDLMTPFFKISDKSRTEIVSRGIRVENIVQILKKQIESLVEKNEI